MTSPDKLYALQLAFKECGVILTAEQVRRVLDHAQDVAGVAATPMAESSGVYPGCAVPSALADLEKWLGPFDKPALGANETDPRWPAYGPGPGGQTDREGGR